jgi:hypothetical protein
MQTHQVFLKKMQLHTDYHAAAFKPACSCIRPQVLAKGPDAWGW